MTTPRSSAKSNDTLNSSRTFNKRRKNQRKKRNSNEFDYQKLEDRIVLTAGNGLLGQYYANPDLSDINLTRVDSSVDFDWESGAYDASGSSDLFSVRWTGQIESQFTETYSFIVNANDGARLWVNGQLLVDEFNSGSVTDATATIDLIAGRRYDIQFEYREDTGDASVKLDWSSASLPQEVIPMERLYASDRGTVMTETWNGISGSDISDLTGDTDFPATPAAVSSLTSFEATSNASDNFGQRISGLLSAPETGPYIFYIAANDSAELWLSNSSDPNQKQKIAFVDSATGPQEWDAIPEQESSLVYLAAGQQYYIESLHKEATGDDHLAVGWRRPGNSNIEVIQGEYLSPVRPDVRIYSDLPNVAEGSPTPASFTIVRSGGPLNNPLDVSYQLTGEATNGVDYQSLSGTATIPAGSDSVSLTIDAIADSESEGDESVIVEILSAAGYNVGFKGERTANGKIQDDAPAPAGGDSLVTGSALSDFSRFGATYSTVNDPIEGDVIQAVMDTPTGNPWGAQLKQNIAGPVAAGDILLMEFRVRSVGGPGEIAAIFERAGSPFTKSLNQGMPASDDWQKIQIPFISEESYAAGEASFGFFLDYQAQTIRLTDFVVTNYGPPKTLAPETAFGLNNNSNGPYGVAQTVQVDGQTFTFAYEVETQVVPEQVWHLQAVERNEAVVANGDTMRFEFSARATAGATPRAGFVVQKTGPFNNLHSQLINLTSDWQTFSVDVVAEEDFDINGLQVVFNLGYELQTVEIGGFHWTNQSNNFDFEELPTQFPATTYVGRNGVDPWRDAADERIANDRKSNVTINVTDINGQPLSGAVVSLRQNNHAFKFGSAINAYNSKLDPNGTDQALKYQSEINRLFNTVVFENSLKWPGYQNDPQRAIDGVNWAAANDLYIRGHNIIWPSRKSMPSNVWAEYDTRVIDDGQASAEAWLQTTIEARFDDVLNQFDGLIPEWDIVNEPWSNHDVMDILGDDILIDWFQRVRDFDPDIKLTLNDFQIFSANGSNTAHRANFDNWLGQLRDANLLDIIGEQSHYGDSNLTDIEVFGQLINSYQTEFNAPIVITEFDVNTSDLQLQADYLRDYMTMSFSQTGVEEFLHWGFWEDSHWLPDASLYRNDFSIKPNGQAYEDLVFGSWWTDIQGTTRDGSMTANAFQGTYDVIVEYDGQTFTSTVTVDDSGTSNATVNLQAAPIDYGPVDRFVFYKASSFDATEASDAIAPGKSPLLHGQTATFENYTSYVHGINGLIIDLPNSATVTASDFEFKFGNEDNVDNWTPITPNVTITTITAGGAGKTDRLLIEFDDGAITNGWLQVNILANANTGLSADDIFYFGNVIGETGNDSNNAIVNIPDVSLTRAGQTGFGTTDILNPFDFNRDQRVNLADLGIARTNQSGFSPVNLITPTNGSNRLSPGVKGEGSDSLSKNFTSGRTPDGFVLLATKNENGSTKTNSIKGAPLRLNADLFFADYWNNGLQGLANRMPAKETFVLKSSVGGLQSNVATGLILKDQTKLTTQMFDEEHERGLSPPVEETQSAITPSLIDKVDAKLEAEL